MLAHSHRWAIRNSAMMVFSAVVQRAVDNDKSSGNYSNSRAVTAEEFFARYPTLFPFLLKELAHLVGFSVHLDDRSGMPFEISSEKSILDDKTKNLYRSDGKHLDAASEHPSVFPLLLLLSKFLVYMF